MDRLNNTNLPVIVIGFLFSLCLFFPMGVINLFNWFMIFEDGNIWYYICLGYFFIPIVMASYITTQKAIYTAFINATILYIALETFNYHIGVKFDSVAFLTFIIGYFIFIVWVINFILKVKNFDTKGLSSYPNPKHLKHGYQWSYLKDIQKILFFKDASKNLYLDNFKVDRKIPNQQQVESTMNFINPLDTTKTILALGKMGSGKTEFFNSVLAQNINFELYNREVIHDVKGDFATKFYDPLTDFIFNPYDDRGCYWDIFEDMKENETLVISFVLNLIEFHQKEKDFFSSSASKELAEMLMKTHFTNIDKSSSEKWIIFLNEIENYKNECGDDRTKTSIYANMELGIETFKLFAWQSAQSNIKRFTLKEFINGKGRLILLNNASYSKKLYPIFTGFVAMLIEKLLSKPDTKEDLTLLLLDEYLGMKFDEDVRLKLQTQIRSKGGCLFIGIQYIDMHDKKAKQLLDSSKYATLIFSVSDGETVQHLTQAFGNVVYEKIKKSNSATSGKQSSSSTTDSIEDKTEPFITPKHIQSMPEFHHLTLIPEKEIFYLGYTPLVELETINESFEKRDLTGYYDFIYNIKSKNIIPQYTLLEKRDIYLELREIDTDDENFDTKMDEWHKKYNLQNIDLKEFFKELFEEDNIA
jgi:hypothetical protein